MPVMGKPLIQPNANAFSLYGTDQESSASLMTSMHSNNMASRNLSDIELRLWDSLNESGNRDIKPDHAVSRCADGNCKHGDGIRG